MTDLFNPFSLALLGALEHLSWVMDVMYVSLLSRLDLTISYPISYMAKFCAGESSKQKESKMSKTYLKSGSKIRVRSLYLSPILH